MTVNGIVETAISVTDIEVSAKFYEQLFGFERLVADERLCALAVAPGQVFLIFLRGGSQQPVTLPEGRGIIPGHDSRGQQHFAFGIPTADFDAWCDKLAAHNIEIESIVHWPLGGRSLYFRDPDGHAVELITPGVWKNY